MWQKRAKSNPDIDPSEPKIIRWELDPEGMGGVGQTTADCDRVASSGFSNCLGLIVQDTESNHAYGFHIAQGVVTEGQLQALHKIGMSGKQYRACFIVGQEGFSPEKEMNYCLSARDERCTLQGVIDALAPNIEWAPAQAVALFGWAFDYNAKDRKLTINSNDGVYKTINNPLDLEPLKWVGRSVPVMGPGESMARTK